MTRTGIEYLDYTCNPIVGCDMSLSCAPRCWARRMAGRLKAAGVPQYQDVVYRWGDWTGRAAFSDTVLQSLLRKRKPGVVGLCFMGDAFHESVPDEWLDQMLAVVALTPHLKYVLLTKRARRMREYSQRISDGLDVGLAGAFCNQRPMPNQNWHWPLPNVALGVSVEDRKHRDRIDILRTIPATMRFLSLEPLLEDIGELGLFESGIDWVIAGGESGPGARPMHPDWVRSIRDQCQAAGVLFFFKQWGEWADIQNFPEIHPDGQSRWWEPQSYKATVHKWPDGALSIKGPKQYTGRLLDGRTWDELPEMLRGKV